MVQIELIKYNSQIIETFKINKNKGYARTEQKRWKDGERVEKDWTKKTKKKIKKDGNII